MAYSIEEEDKMLAMFETIANQPIEQQRPYNEVKNPKPIVESACFEGVKVDFSGWTEDKKKVGKAKTASNPDLAKQSKNAPKVTDVDTKGTAVATKGAEKPVTENDTVTEKKEDKQVTKLVTEDASHEAKGEPKAKTGNFDSKAKSTASAQRSKADSNKKFSEESKKQRKIDMFRDFVKSLGVDKESKEAAEKVLKKFDQISKHIGEPGDGKVKTESVTDSNKKIINEAVRETLLPASERVNTFLEIVDTLGPGEVIDKEICERIAKSIRRMIETGTRTAEIGSPSWSVPDHDIERIKMMLEQSGIDVQITKHPSFVNGRPMTITLTGDLGTVDGMSDTPDDIQANLSMELKSKGYASVMDKIADAVENDKAVAPVFTGPSKVRISPRVNPEFYRENGLKSGDPSPHTMNAIDTLRPILRKYGYKSMVRDDGYETTLYVKIPDRFIGDFD